MRRLSLVDQFNEPFYRDGEDFLLGFYSLPGPTLRGILATS